VPVLQAVILHTIVHMDSSKSSRILKKIRDLRNEQLVSKNQLELTIETTQRDSRYSTSLVDLMKREEVALKDAAIGNSVAINAVVQKVDDALRAETSSFFEKSAQHNLKLWKSMRDKNSKKVTEITMECDKYIGASSCSTASSCSPVGRSVPSSEELEKERERLEIDYNTNWFKYEIFNLQEAFNSQSARVESDWRNHEDAIIEEFSARKGKMTGVVPAASPERGGSAADEQSRWHHPEKQKTLIHTVPVLAPSTAGAATAAYAAHESSRGTLLSRGANSRRTAKNVEVSIIGFGNTAKLVSFCYQFLLSFGLNIHVSWKK
jgi:hypothetical protein